MKETKTAVIEVRCDLRTLAALALYYARHNVHTNSKSALVANVLEDFLSVLIKNGKVSEIQTTTEAVETLSSLGLTGFNRSGRGCKALAHQLKLEGMAVESKTDESFVQSLLRKVKE